MILRAFVQAAPTTTLEDERSIVVDGFEVTLPKGLPLTKRAFVHAPNPRMFSKADGFGKAIDGAIYCNAKWMKAGPFTSGETLTRFTAIPCFLDAENDGVFESVAFFSLGTREVGPVPIVPLRYRPVLGDFTKEHVDLIVQRVGAGSIFVTPTLYDAEGKHGSIRLYTDERDRTSTDYARGCVFTAPSNTNPSSALGAQIAIEAVDAKAETFQATITSVGEPKPVSARVKNWQFIYDFLPSLSERCGDKR
ncbi:hypothetical protein QH494_03860 [Sphingomonas sp. AR_OL41]|uniref:hypothetical protein n=1 Tax=Sphingomonas sp. AR_OL41 TaxID=3042729 RepID=UPI002481373B|nr:hypothetical protein [Sphingomonas sp. AR_OL41]MDH7971306.1 hypothetical protein [Sphingomonas sp. AR_OL41]